MRAIKLKFAETKVNKQNVDDKLFEEKRNLTIKKTRKAMTQLNPKPGLKIESRRS